MVFPLRLSSVFPLFSLALPNTRHGFEGVPTEELNSTLSPNTTQSRNQVLSQHATNITFPSSRHALTRRNNFTTIPGLQGQEDREVRLRSPQTGSSSTLPMSGKPHARGELSRAQERDRPRPPSLHATRLSQNTSKDQTRVVRLVQDAIGQMPPIRSHRKPERWRGERSEEHTSELQSRP